MRYFWMVLCMFPLSLLGQNLVMNGSFEDENICSEFAKNCAPEGWISTSLTADYYFGDPGNAYGGEHFVGLIGLVPDFKFRKFVRSRLLCGLRAGAQYRVSLAIRSGHPFLDSVGIYFSPDDILFRKTGLRDAVPQLWIFDSLRSREAPKWTRVSMTFRAQGNEGYITIGDFRRRPTATTMRGVPDLGSEYYYFIDDVELVPVNTHERLCAAADSVREEVYEWNDRHALLEKKVYQFSRRPPEHHPLPTTLLQRIDTLIIPDVLFATNSFELNAQAYRLLDSFVRRSAGLAVDSLVVEGHTDSTGAVAWNEKLSNSRAAGVGHYLRPFFSTQVRTRGWASRRPVADNRTRNGRQKNRRVELYLYVRE